MHFVGGIPWPRYTQVLLALGHLKVCVRTARLLRLSGVTCGTSCATPSRHSTINTVTNMIKDAIKMSLEDWNILQHIIYSILEDIGAYWNMNGHISVTISLQRSEGKPACLKRHDRKQSFPGCTQASRRGGAPSRPVCRSIPWEKLHETWVFWCKSHDVL